MLKAIVNPCRYNKFQQFNQRAIQYSFKSWISFKTALMDQIMEWKKAFAVENGVNPKQDDTLKDQKGQKLFNEFQALEAAEEKKSVDSILTEELKERKENITKELKLWRENFEKETGKNPNRYFYAGKPARAITIENIETNDKNKIKKGTLRGRFLKKIFPNSSDQDALKTIYASLQIQYGHCEERLHSLYGDSEPVIGDPRTISKYIVEGLEKESKIEDYDEKEAYQLLKKERQGHFTKGLLWFSKRSGFKASSIHDEIYCKTNHYRLTVPIRIDWNYFDATIFNKLKPYETTFAEIEKPTFSNRAIILVRGQGVDSTTGFFLTEKFDEITTRMARTFIDKSINSVRSLLGLKERKKQLTFGKIKDGTQKEYEDHKLAILGSNDDSKTALSQVKFNGIATLLGRIKLQEETFEDVLVLYVTRRTLEIENGLEVKRYKNTRSINLRHFRSVPKCDLEFVLPDQAQKVYMRPMDKLLLGFSFLGGTGVATHFYLTGLQFTQTGAIALTAFCAYFIRIFNRYRMSKFYYRSAMAQ